MSVDVEMHGDVLSGFVSETLETVVHVCDPVHVNVHELMSSDEPEVSHRRAGREIRPG